MTEPPVDRHVEAAKHEVRLHAWGAQRVDDAWRELALRRRREGEQRQRVKAIGGSALAIAAMFALALVAWRMLRPDAATAPREAVADGSGTCEGDGAECPEVYDTRTAGIVGVSLGILSGGASAWMFVADR